MGDAKEAPTKKVSVSVSLNVKSSDIPKPPPKPAPRPQAAITQTAPGPQAAPEQHIAKPNELKEVRKGVFRLGEGVEGWLDKTKAVKEEYKRQCEANEQFFVKEAAPVKMAPLNDPSEGKIILDIKGLKGYELVNLLRCVIDQYRNTELGPFFFQFADDKKFKLELMPTASQPGNGLVKSVGRLKYYSYPDMCNMLVNAGVTSKGLGNMISKLNTEGMKSALHNQISPINELHFMLMFEVAKRLVRGPHGFPVASQPELDQLPIGVAIARMIILFCKGKTYLDYETVFGAQDKYNPFLDTSVVLRRQKIVALNKAFFEAEVRGQIKELPLIGQFLKYHNGYVLKSVEGYLQELRDAFGSPIL
ncbi:uncharacterized protein LOC116603754 isoform X2 [Nematostella vectensis]|uniref:uncharacterized protein LOC116603754 isoform X2 n=1 Tax=Nematostella vectensis TaxID=45351 RepID=UPI0020775F9D|nr:uncharacterized protein LOC116603754 isoform X2 [Nematostella vectensis]